MTTANEETDATLDRVLSAMKDLRDGNFRRRLVVPGNGPVSALADVFNEIAERNQWLAGELGRVRQAVGQEGRLTERVAPAGTAGGWSLIADSVNGLVEDLMRPTTELSRVLAAVAEGDLTKRMSDQTLRGEFATLGSTVNGLVDQLSSFADEVTRVAREVGTEGRLGGQAKVPGVAGTWRDL
ncbi:hypothetical protein SAMN05216553_11534, partial [Lentzea fradiae]